MIDQVDAIDRALVKFMNCDNIRQQIDRILAPWAQNRAFFVFATAGD